MTFPTAVSGSHDAVALPEGVGVALVTYFGGDGRPDAAATARRARECVARGVGLVLVAGTTGEAPRLSADDRIALATAVKEAAGDAAVIVGTGSPEEDQALETTSKVAAADVADALLVYAPPGADARTFFGRVRDSAGELRVVAYHNPQLASTELEPSLIAELGVAAVKDSSGSTNRLAELVELGVRVYVGSPTQLVVAGGCGAAGALLAVANVAPSLCVAAWHGDLAAQRALFPLHVRTGGDFDFLRATAPDALPAARAVAPLSR